VEKGISAPARRADCPHAPHDGPCGAVRPICPACRTVRTQVIVPYIVNRVRENGTEIAQCSGCGTRSLCYDADMICDTCEWLVPDVNDRLLKRFTINGGPFDPKPGVCPGCGHKGAALPVSFPVQCPRCATASMVEQQAVDVSAGVRAYCSNKDCRYPIKVPAAIWCPECGLNLRPPTQISALIRKANEDAGRH
jgi:hypothetical protein